MAMAYEQTHPWITFELDLGKAPPPLWIALGEAYSKCQHLAGVPLKPEIASKLHQIYLAKGIHATTAIEGNTLNERQVLDRIQGKDVVPKSQQYLEKEVDNVLASANLVMDEVEDKGIVPITSDEIKKLNKSILTGLELEDRVIPGEYRKYQVGVLDYEGAPWEDCPYLIDQLSAWLNSDNFVGPGKDQRIIYGIVKSIIAHIYMAWIHPFGDGNGRTARMLEVKFLMEAGIPSSAIYLLSNHYNATRVEYYRRLSQISKNGGDVIPFLDYAVRGFVDQLRDQLEAVKAQQWGVSWQNFIYEVFGPEKTIADKRQIALLLALSETDDFVPKNNLRRLTPRLAEMYAGKTSKTLTRDLNSLARRKMIQSGPKGVRARKELILAFLPRTRMGDFEAQLEHAKRMKAEEGHLQLDLLSLLEDSPR